MNLKISLLDMVVMYQGDSVAQTIENTVDFAQQAEQLGYHRYWFTEHHNTHNLVCPSPALLIAHIAAQTTTIRLGAGGVMLPNHSPLRVAEDFALLAGIHNDRIDLGLGRAPGTDGLTALALRRTREAVYRYDFPEHLDELLHYFKRDFPADAPFARIQFSPSTEVPRIFMLGSSNGGVNYAAARGLSFVFAAHMAPQNVTAILQHYRQTFVPSMWNEVPHPLFSIGVIVAETEQEAMRLAKPAQMYWARIFMGDSRVPFPTLTQAEGYEFSEAEQLTLAQMSGSILVGSAAQVAERLKKMALAANVEEVLTLTFYPDKASRLKGQRLLAEALK
ncbi:LLM class flavin-dependent oxidoreductase [Metalysinibacillus jejuensis]|uniref:LLM class flavin-dependent oxidoreductase n=1 Tax=Metalysinibacillus jejuensis TaxID=914327 RepID=UPI0013798D2D|nr:LLM class flavin-dependent oxidoreductase [Metalysinibacillus jejuensis]